MSYIAENFSRVHIFAIWLQSPQQIIICGLMPGNHTHQQLACEITSAVFNFRVTSLPSINAKICTTQNFPLYIRNVPDTLAIIIHFSMSIIIISTIIFTYSIYRCIQTFWSHVICAEISQKWWLYFQLKTHACSQVICLLIA